MNLADPTRERHVFLGLVRLDGFASDLALTGCSPPCFTDPLVRDLVLAATTLAESGRPIRELDLHEELTRLKRLTDRHKDAIRWAIGTQGQARDALLSDARRVVELWRARQALAVLTQAQREFDPGDLERSTEDTRAKLTQALDLLGEKHRPKSWKLNVLDWCQDVTRKENRRRDARLMPTHLAALDRLLGGGLQPGVYTIIAARPSQGKSAMLKSIVHKQMRTRQPPTKLFSPEMSTKQIVERLVIEECHINRDDLLYGDLIADQYQRFQDAVKWTHGLPIEVDDSAHMSIADVCAGIREWARQLWPGATKENPPPAGEMGLVGIDYLQKLKGPPGLPRNASPRDVNTAISRNLAALIRDFPWIVFLALAQLSRGMAREDRDPTLEDLKEAGAYEEDADTILMIKRWGDAYKDMHGTTTIDGRLMTIFARKNRNGAVSACDLHYLERLTAFYDWADDFPKPRMLKALYAGEVDQNFQPVETRRGRGASARDRVAPD